MITTPRWRWPLFLSGLLLLSQAFPLPSPVRDAATLQSATGFHMAFQAWHLLFTPFCSVADLLTVQSLHQIQVLVVYLLIGCVLLGRKRGPVLFFFFILFVAWGALVPRPMGRLVAEDPEVCLVDFHSHSQVSHDGRPSFTPEANRRWHERQGFHAAFITDHNRTESAHAAKEASRQDWGDRGYRSLEGEEVSLQKTHVVVLGNHDRIDNKPFDGDMARIPGFIATMHKAGLPVIASLPEYWFYHWEKHGETGASFTYLAGVDGFEILNSAPKALDFPLTLRHQVVDACRDQNIFMTGISDNHGYGYATAAWNALRLPGWKAMDPDTLERAILAHLKSKGFDAVQVLERLTFTPNTPLELAIAPVGLAVVYWRSLQPLQAVSWVFWIWLLFICYPSRHSVTQRSGSGD